MRGWFRKITILVIIQNLLRKAASHISVVMTQNALVNCNPELKEDHEILTHKSHIDDSPALSSYLNIAVPKLLQSDSDLKLFSLELEKLLDTPELKFEFGSAIHNPLRVCNFDALTATRSALDLSQDFGGSAQFLSETFSHVDSIKLNQQRAQFSKARFPSVSNITFIAAQPNQLSLPTEQYDFIYVGKLEDLLLSVEETQTFLSLLRKSLTKNGVLLVNFKNRDRLSKWLNTSPSNLESKTPYTELYDNEKQTLFNLSQIESSLDKSGYKTIKLNSSYSANGEVSNLLSSDYINNSPDALNHFYRIGALANSRVNEYLVYKAQQLGGSNINSLASRFVVFTDCDGVSANKLFNKDFCHFPGTSRRTKWRAITSKNAHAHRVIKQAIQSNTANTQEQELLTQDLSAQPFQSGTILVSHWLNAVVDKNENEFSSLVKSYYSWLLELKLEDSEFLPTSAYDLLPFNVICSSNDEFTDRSHKTSYQAIDQEWHLNTEFTPDFVLFRALFWFAFENRMLLADFGDRWGFHSIDAFVRHYLDKAAGATIDTDKAQVPAQLLNQDAALDQFIDLEESVQREISHTFNSGSIRHSMHQRFAAETPLSFEHNITQITWADSANNFDQANTVSLDWMLSDGLQVISSKFDNKDRTNSILRIDPIQSAGLFQLTEVALLNDSGAPIWQAKNSQEIIEQASLHNLTVVSKYGHHHFIAANNDPFLLIDLTELDSLTELSSIELKLGLIYEPNYQRALGHLQTLVDTQAASITRLGNKSHESQADLDLLQAKLSDLKTQNVHTENNNEHLNQHLKQIIAENERLKHSLSRLERSFANRLLSKLASILRRSE